MAEKAKSYSYVAFQGAWTGRSRGMWSTAILGVVFGAILGAVAPFFPILVGAQTLAGAAGIMGQTAAIFSAVGMGLGFTAGGLLGSSAGAIASVTKEQENRDLKRLEENTPSPQISQNKLVSNPLSSVDTASSPSLKDTFRTYVNPRVGLAITAIALVGGAIMSSALIAAGGVGAAESAIPGLALAVGKGGSDAAVTAYITGVMGSFGSLWFLNFPKIATDLQDVTGRLLSGELLGRTWEPEKSQEPTIKISTENPEPQTLLLDTNADISTHFRDKVAAEVMHQHSNNLTAVRH